MVPTELFRASRPGSPIGQDASAFPLLTHCDDATWLRQFAIASQIAKSGHPRRSCVRWWRDQAVVRRSELYHRMPWGPAWASGSNLKTAAMTTAAIHAYTSQFGFGNLACAVTNCRNACRRPALVCRT